MTPASGASSSTPRCALCEAEAMPDARYCVACGAPLDQSPGGRPARRSLAPIRIVEVDATALSAPAEPAESLTLDAAGARPTGLAALPRLAALAWRQPAVRSVATTGASAVALSLAWRVVEAALRGGRASNTLLAEDALVSELLSELLSDATAGKRLRRLGKRAGRRGRRGEVIEEVIYARRVPRR